MAFRAAGVDVQAAAAAKNAGHVPSRVTRSPAWPARLVLEVSPVHGIIARAGHRGALPKVGMSDRGGLRRSCAPDDEFRLVETLYASEAPRLGHKRHVGSAGQDRADLVHDTFARLLALGPERLRLLAAEQPVSYLRRIARHIGLDQAKRDRRRSAALHVPLEDADVRGIDLERQLEARDTLRHVELAVAAMPPRTRSIFIARRVHGMGYAEIADTCGMSVKAVEKQMRRALQILSREMDTYGDD